MEQPQWRHIIMNVYALSNNITLGNDTGYDNICVSWMQF